MNDDDFKRDEGLPTLIESGTTKNAPLLVRLQEARAIPALRKIIDKGATLAVTLVVQRDSNGDLLAATYREVSETRLDGHSLWALKKVAEGLAKSCQEVLDEGYWSADPESDQAN
ncbi:MAG TPA: hypothetical protein VM285_04750 [Polyangia bacterium]|nr:hypothetical protein [Polyangia bacterium]